MSTSISRNTATNATRTGARPSLAMLITSFPSSLSANFIAARLNGIIGLEIPITALEGKWKVSQNRTLADRQGVINGLQCEQGCPAMAALVSARQAE
ncbi:hypothetical protein [Dickeya zeae]|uniref:hypothetical protein n=1 Tax=Dickeya zeae TaxID=204042 RepID=UPI001F0E721D|nr:hypothetical protein [Dickeya zeae]